MDTGRYHVVTPSGRKFTVEPLAARDQKIDGQVFTNGGLSGTSTKNDQRGGAIRESESVITPDRGYRNITVLPAGVSPNDFIDALAACRTVEEEEAVLARYR